MKLKTLILVMPILGLGSALSADDVAPGLWAKHCAKCHAKDGSANTPIGKKLKVGDYTDPATLADVSDEELFEMTKAGVKGTKMPGFEKKLADEEIQALVTYMRGMAKS